MTPNDELNPPRPRFAATMFWLAFAYLLTVAGVIHRAHQTDISNLEEWVLAVSLMVLWPLFPAEAIYAARRRHESQPRGRAIRRAILVSLFPPLRMGLCHPVNGLVWLPRLGWRMPGKDLLAKLDHIFRVPMLVISPGSSHTSVCFLAVPLSLRVRSGTSQSLSALCRICLVERRFRSSRRLWRPPSGSPSVPCRSSIGITPSKRSATAHVTTWSHGASPESGFA